MKTQDKIMTYVFDGKEVHLTGRIATPQKNAPKTSQRMVEVVPVGSADGDTTYAKWVKMSELLIIQNLENEEFNETE